MLASSSKYKLTTDTVITATGDQVSAELAGEGVLLDIKSGMYYGLNSVGTRIWQLVQEPQTVQDICDVILDEYEVEPARCKQDVLALLSDMQSKGLVEVKQ